VFNRDVTTTTGWLSNFRVADKTPPSGQGLAWL
jgi:hypothetical protein